MTNYTPLQTLAKVHRELWWTIRLLGSVTVRLDGKNASWADCVEVDKVLRAAVEEVGKIIRRETENQQNPRNRRPGSDLALKAQLAKARGAVAEALKVVPDGPSHK